MSNLVIMTSSDLEDSRQSRLDVLYPDHHLSDNWVGVQDREFQAYASERQETDPKKKNIKKKSGYVFPETHVPLYCETVVHIIQRRKMPKATRMNSKPNVPICSEPVPGAGRTLGTDKTPKKQCTDPPIMQCGNQALVSPGIEKTPRT
jgi:hypothetical protein